jgi:hypothetical protein
MTYHQYITHLKVCEYLNRPPKKVYLRLKYKIDKMWDNCEICIDPSVPNMVIFHKKRKHILGVNIHNPDEIHIHKDIFSDFETFFYINELSTSYIEDFLQRMVSEHLSMNISNLRSVWFQRKVSPIPLVVLTSPSDQETLSVPDIGRT